ncbi:hypothetical protein CCACVL1_17185 [Corchorus capsularis]|uniref:Uncharacterized protein n=1 Tax=Corchorus capsularis TaxID=210143 RepID=A0A1R3HTI3_COCAP|nr:hypothetical protein CCACVL1_17185 [Corchorus capsularis]
MAIKVEVNDLNKKAKVVNDFQKKRQRSHDKPKVKLDVPQSKDQ